MKKWFLSIFVCFLIVEVSAQETNITPLNSNTDSLNTRFQKALNGIDLLYKQRLDSAQSIVSLDFNDYVKQYIEIYTKRKSMYADMLSRSTYYFPIFEKALQAYQVPEEIKYLTVVESSLNPHAVSRVGATGLWQFMYRTAQFYHLNMDNFEDERKDPVKASYAAAAYLRDAYNQLGDWTLAIASYNCGAANVNKAIEKSGSRNFWELRDFLPAETRNYIPAFIAAVYIMKYANQHEINEKPPLFTFKVDSIQVRNFVSLNEVARIVKYSTETITALNPSFKQGVINGTDTLPKRLVLPKVDLLCYNELYEVLNRDIDIDRTVIPRGIDEDKRISIKPKKEIQKPKYIVHKVLKGQNLFIIAQKYGVEVDDLKAWNNMKKSTLVSGQKLKIFIENQVIAKVSNSPKNNVD